MLHTKLRATKNEMNIRTIVLGDGEVNFLNAKHDDLVGGEA